MTDLWILLDSDAEGAEETTCIQEEEFSGKQRKAKCMSSHTVYKLWGLGFLLRIERNMSLHNIICKGTAQLCHRISCLHVCLQTCSHLHNVWQCKLENLLSLHTAFLHSSQKPCVICHKNCHRTETKRHTQTSTYQLYSSIQYRGNA